MLIDLLLILSTCDPWISQTLSGSSREQNLLIMDIFIIDFFVPQIIVERYQVIASLVD